MTELDQESVSAKGRAQAKAIEAALFTIAAEGIDAVLFNDKGALGVKIDSRYNIMELAAYMDVRRVGNMHLLCERDVLANLLVVAATSYAFVYAQTQIGFNSEPPAEPVPEGGEGENVLPVSESPERRLHLVGSGPVQGVPGSEGAQHAVDAFDRR